MDKLFSKLINESANLKKNTLWYTLGSFFNSLSSIILTLSVTRILGTTQSGIFAIGWAIGQLMLTIGWFNTRQFQISDVHERFKLQDYLSLKLITVIIMIVGCIVYSVLLRQSVYKMYVALSITGLMVSEVFADVFSGYFQQKGKLHIAGKSYFFRILLYDIAFVIMLYLSKNIILSVLISLLLSVIWVICFDLQIAKKIEVKKLYLNFSQTFKLLYVCFPLFIGSFLSSFIANAPKNAIELYLNDNTQALFGIVFMPAALINLFGMFIFVPLFTELAQSWNHNNFKRFFKTIRLILIYIIGIIIIVLLGGYLVGIPILSFVYKVDLTGYLPVLMTLLLAGGLNSVIYVATFIITVMQKQYTILVAYFSVAIITVFLTDYFVVRSGVFGVSMVYLFANTLLMLLLILVCVFNFKKEVRKLNSEVNHD